MDMEGRMKKVAIITRAFNRLEYTIRCVNSVRDNTLYPYYVHIVVDNASTDGTRQWLQWVKKEIPDWFPNLHPVFSGTNLGDWGGLIFGAKQAPADCHYIMQLDNDFEVESCWLSKTVALFEKIPEKILQLRRVGVRSVVTPSKLRHVGEYQVGQIKRPVGCFILRQSDFKKALPHIDNNSLKYGKTQLSRYLGGTAKVIDLCCPMIDGSTKTGYVNYEKYPPGKC